MLSRTDKLQELCLTLSTGLSILQYADDKILSMEHDLDKARNLKLFLSAFEQMSGLKINFHKCELFCFGKAKEAAAQYAYLFGCEEGQFLINGVPLLQTRNMWKNA